MELNDDGTITKELLRVTMVEDKGVPLVRWDFEDRENAYFLIGVLEVIKQQLLDEINEQSEEANNEKR